MNNSSNKIIGLILAGGEGRRLGGKDKGLQEYKGKPLIEHVINALTPQTNKVVLSVNRNLDRYQQYGLELVTDQSCETYQGPLAGIVAAAPLIKESEKEYVLLASCDAPNLPSDYAVKMYDRLKQNSAIATVAHDGDRTQNLHCLIRSNALNSLIEFYQQGGRALYQWFEQNQIIEVDFSDQAECFSNINTLEQLKTFT